MLAKCINIKIVSETFDKIFVKYFYMLDVMRRPFSRAFSLKLLVKSVLTRYNLCNCSNNTLLAFEKMLEESVNV